MSTRLDDKVPSGVKSVALAMYGSNGVWFLAKPEKSDIFRGVIHYLLKRNEDVSGKLSNLTPDEKFWFLELNSMKGMKLLPKDWLQCKKVVFQLDMDRLTKIQTILRGMECIGRGASLRIFKESVEDEETFGEVIGRLLKEELGPVVGAIQKWGMLMDHVGEPLSIQVGDVQVFALRSLVPFVTETFLGTAEISKMVAVQTCPAETTRFTRNVFSVFGKIVKNLAQIPQVPLNSIMSYTENQTFELTGPCELTLPDGTKVSTHDKAHAKVVRTSSASPQKREREEPPSTSSSGTPSATDHSKRQRRVEPPLCTDPRCPDRNSSVKEKHQRLGTEWRVSSDGQRLYHNTEGWVAAYSSKNIHWSIGRMITDVEELKVHW